VHGAYFETLRMTLIAGRVFDAVEHVEPRGVVIINERLAERFWPGRDPIGRRLKWGPPDGPAPWLTVVGVVGDVDGGRLAASLLGESRPIQAYLPFRQFPDAALDNAVNGFGRDIRLAIASTGDASPLAESLRRELASLDPALAVARMALMEERVSDAVAPQRFSATLLAAFAGGALLLAGIGLYGLLAFTVAQRRRELGVRIALGADARTVIGLVLGEGAALVATGLVLGLLGALAVARLLTSFLFGIDQYDVVAFAVAPLVLTAVTLLACGLPALRAARVDPLLALRDD
jgi:putative ABC transport system permease protein